jgi:hypothetical protein
VAGEDREKKKKEKNALAVDWGILIWNQLFASLEAGVIWKN